MFKYNNTHIFTGYLKQLLSSVNIPTCKIYTREFARYLEQHGKEDPRVVESIDTLNKNCLSARINYLKNNELYNYFYNNNDKSNNKIWRQVPSIFYNSEKNTPGLTKTLCSPGNVYNKITHEYLGEYLRFVRDYHGVNFMSMYNCFNNEICNNIIFEPPGESIIFNSNDSKYNIYAIPVKLFSNYTIAIESNLGIELFCGLYGSSLDDGNKNKDLIMKTYTKVNSTSFHKPFLYDKLNVQYWTFDNDIEKAMLGTETISGTMTRWDILNRERDLKLFIKVPVNSRSSIVILEGDYRSYNDSKYSTNNGSWEYKRNHSIINFGNNTDKLKVNPNTSEFTPISKLQLLEFNTGESYPFADRLVEYLSGSAITPLDEISDNIKRAQKVMTQNKHYFKIDGLWENKMQKIIYDYITNSGPIEANNDGKLIDKRKGYHTRLGHANKSMLYDVLGYIDRDAEKWYASWKNENNKAVINNTIQNVDIYDGLYDL